MFVSVPTFVTFLREIESALDVREYCKLYLGESNATHQFATSFLEKRRSFRPKNNAQKDDMCSPAPAITPSLQHSTEFQEVKVRIIFIKSKTFFVSCFLYTGMFLNLSINIYKVNTTYYVVCVS